MPPIKWFAPIFAKYNCGVAAFFCGKRRAGLAKCNRMENQSEGVRADGRAFDELRPVSFQTGVAANAGGSVLVTFGNTRVICAACLERRVPAWLAGSNPPKGWITAEYSMLPYSTLSRKPRPSAMKPDGRAMEIQRLIGRSIRAVADLGQMIGFTLFLDCDVIQADGGTRTASICGAYVAAKIAVAKLLKRGELASDPFVDSVAAVSVGLLGGRALLDLPYSEDVDADVDANVVMTGSAKFVELQFSGEEAVFDGSQVAEMCALAKKGIGEILELQRAAIDSAIGASA